MIPPHAEADLFVRSLPDSDFVARVRELAPPDGRALEVSATPADRFPRLPGFEHATVTFGSDAPRLRKLIPSRRVALCGPGSIRVDEHVPGTDLRAGCELLVAVADTLQRSTEP